MYAKNSNLQHKVFPENMLHAMKSRGDCIRIPFDINDTNVKRVQN